MAIHPNISVLLRGLVASLWLGFATAAMAQETKNVLVLYGNNAELPWIKIFDASLRSAVRGATRARVEFYTEYFDVARFPGRAHHEAFIDLVRTRYADRRIDVVVSGGSTAFDFLVSRRKDLFPGVPLVYSFLPPDRIDASSLPAGIFGVPVDFRPLPSVELALRLHPGAKRLVLVTGAGPWDLAWEKRLRQDAAGLQGRVELEFLARLPMAEVLARLGALTREAIVFTPGFFRDGAGEVFATSAAVEAMAARSTVPVYTSYETHIGGGATGGVMPTFDAVGRQTGEIVAAVLDGKRPEELKLPSAVAGTALVDWRQVRRWGIDEDLLPPGTDVRFREPSAWSLYKREISLAIVVVLLQAALIAMLLVERRRRRRAAIALADSEQRANLAARAAGLSAWIWETDGGRIRTAALPGSPDDLLDSVHPADRQEVRRAVGEALAKDTELNIEYRVLRPSGEVRWISARGRAQKTRERHLIGVSLDVTERKQSELRSAQDRASLRHMTRVSMLGQLSAAIAHQLNQPLAAILGNAEAAQKMLGRDKVDLTELRAICDDIVAEDHRAAEVIRRLRELYRRGEIRREPCDLNALVREMVDLLRTELLTRRVAAATELEPSLPPIQVDRVQLQQVLLNLILNAADAMSEDAEERRIVTIRTERAGDRILLSVVDCGHGVAAENLAHVFEGFWSTKPEGMGVGLAISKSIVEAHGGSLTASNNPGGGATFRASLPAPA